MKKLLVGLLALGSISSFATCDINIDRVKDQDIGGIKKFERILKKKGYQVTEDVNATYSVEANYRYTDRVGSANQLLGLSLNYNGGIVSVYEGRVKETIGMKLMERRVLINFTKTIQTCY